MNFRSAVSFWSLPFTFRRGSLVPLALPLAAGLVGCSARIEVLSSADGGTSGAPSTASPDGGAAPEAGGPDTGVTTPLGYTPPKVGGDD